MKIVANRAESFVKSPDPAMRAVLVYGPDGGLVRERADRLVAGVAGDVADPFRVAELTPSALKDDPARLADEAAALALTGGRRAVRLRDAGDALSGLVGRFLEDPAGDALVVVEAGELGPRSSLRKLFEGAANAAALPCYADEGAGLEALVRDSLRQNNLAAEPEALAWLVEHLGGDRKLTRQELAKLALYMGGPGTVRLADAVACIGDTAALSLDDLAMAAADGDQATLQRVLDRVLLEGTSPVAVVRAAARHFQRLHLAAGLMAAGRGAEQAMAALKPPVIFRQQARFAAQAKGWPADRLGVALDLLTAAEIDCKTTGLPAAEACGRALMQIARAAPRRAGRPR